MKESEREKRERVNAGSEGRSKNKKNFVFLHSFHRQRGSASPDTLRHTRTHTHASTCNLTHRHRDNGGEEQQQ